MNKKHLELFFEFFVFGILMGISEDAIALILSTGTHITLHVVLIITLVTIPFAIFGELIVDRISIPFFKKHKKLELFLEFLIFGIVLGVIEDIIVITFVTHEPITNHIIIIVTLVAIPFAAIGELLVDRVTPHKGIVKQILKK